MDWSAIVPPVAALLGGGVGSALFHGRRKRTRIALQEDLDLLRKIPDGLSARTEFEAYLTESFREYMGEDLEHELGRHGRRAFTSGVLGIAALVIATADLLTLVISDSHSTDVLAERHNPLSWIVWGPLAAAIFAASVFIWSRYRANDLIRTLRAKVARQQIVGERQPRISRSE